MPAGIETAMAMHAVVIIMRFFLAATTLASWVKTTGTP
jgi:hypothetical protein